ncbi:unnamed protein product [Camellia sinensis]
MPSKISEPQVSLKFSTHFSKKASVGEGARPAKSSKKSSMAEGANASSPLLAGCGAIFSSIEGLMAMYIMSIAKNIVSFVMVEDDDLSCGGH